MERLNGHTKIWLIIYDVSCQDKGTNWDTWLPFACFTYNTTAHTITKYTPYELEFGRKFNIPETLQPLYNYDDFVQTIRNKMQIGYKLVK